MRPTDRSSSIDWVNTSAGGQQVKAVPLPADVVLVVRGALAVGLWVVAGCVDLAGPAGLQAKPMVVDASVADRSSPEPDGPSPADAEPRPIDAGQPDRAVAAPPDAPPPAAPDVARSTPDAQPRDQASDPGGRPDVATATSALIGHWNLDDGQGLTALDSSGNGAHGELVNGPQWVGGRLGGALQFKGAMDHVIVRNTDAMNAALNASNRITVAAWVKYVATTDMQNKLLVGGPLGSGFELRGGWGTNLYFVVALDGVRKGTDEVPAVRDLAWHHVAGVYDGQQVQLWVDGAVKFTTNVTGKLVVKPGPITINQPDTFSFPGALDDVLVYSRALSGAEIGELARGGAPP